VPGRPPRVQQLSAQEISELRGWILAPFDVRGYDARYNKDEQCYEVASLD